jgi:hypothetical protein
MFLTMVGIRDSHQNFSAQYSNTSIATDPRSPRSLSLCPRPLREDADRALYTRLAASSAADPSLHTAFLTTVSQNRRLASYDL